MKRAYKIRLYHTIKQQVFFKKTFGCVRFVQNKYLELKQNIYKGTGKQFYPKLASFKEVWGFAALHDLCHDEGFMTDFAPGIIFPSIMKELKSVEKKNSPKNEVTNE